MMRFKLLVAALAACLFGTYVRANTIQLDLTGYSYDGMSDTTTYHYNVFLTSGSGTPGVTAIFNVEGYLSASYTNSLVFGAPETLAVTGTMSDPGSTNGVTLSALTTTTVAGFSDGDSTREDVRIDFANSIAVNPVGISLGTLDIVSNINKVITTGYLNPSGDIKLANGGPGIHMEDTGGPSANGTPTTPTPAAAMGGLGLFGLVSIFGRRGRRTR